MLNLTSCKSIPVGFMNEETENAGVIGIDNHLLLEHTYKRLHAPLYFYAYKFLKDEEAARDAVQDAFMGILYKPWNSPEIKDISSYLFRSVRNNCLNYLNHQHIENRYEILELERTKREAAYYEMNSTLVEKEMQEKVLNAVDSLPENYRIPFMLSRFENRKNKEIAEILKIPLRTVETRIYRALTILKEKLENQVFTFFSIFRSH